MKYFCPCCNTEVEGFSPGGAHFDIIVELDIVGMGRRLNKNCVMCRSNDRERLVTLYMKQFILSKKFESMNMLHVAPEAMLASILIQDQRIKYIKGDKFAEDYYYPDTIQMDITNITFEDKTFDFIMCNHVLEHIYEDNVAMSEIYRVLKPGGQAILQVPISSVLKKTYEDKRPKTKKMRIKYFGQRNHVRIYAWDYIKRLESVGFQVEIVSFSELYGQEFMEQNGLNVKEKIIVCKKA